MRADEYPNEMAIFGLLANALGPLSDSNGDVGTSFPRSDAKDFSCGARFIPGEVTLARRAGEKVEFNQACNNHCCWYWELEDGTRIYHWDRSYFNADWVNGLELNEAKEEYVVKEGETAHCQFCKSVNIFGGVVKPDKPRAKQARVVDFLTPDGRIIHRRG